jgi:hypothetical protein
MRPLKSLLLCACLLLASQNVQAQSANRPLTANVLGQMQFPRLAVIGKGAGTATIDPVTETVSTTGSARVLGGIASPASLHIIGTPGALVSVRTGSATDLVAASGAIIRLTAINSTGKGGVRLSRSGQARVNLGATLPITAATQAGSYRGRVTVAIDYIFE